MELKTIAITMEDRHWERVDELAEQHHCSPSYALRMLVEDTMPSAQFTKQHGIVIPGTEPDPVPAPEPEPEPAPEPEDESPEQVHITKGKHKGNYGVIDRERKTHVFVKFADGTGDWITRGSVQETS